MELKNYFAQDHLGNVLPNALCYLYQANTETLATGLLNVNDLALPNPFFSDAYGVIQFKAPDGLYDLRVVSGERDYTIRVQFIDVTETMDIANAAKVAAMAAAGSAETSKNTALQQAEIAETAADAAIAAQTQLRNDLAAPTGSSLVGYRRSVSSAIKRTVIDKLSDNISAKDFGAIGDGTYHPVSEWYTVGSSKYRGYASLAAVQADYPHVSYSTQSIDWVAIQAAANSTGGSVRIPEGVYWMNEHLNVPNGVTLVGDGVDYWDLKASWRPRRMVTGTTLLFGGTPTITKTVLNVSNMRVAGGVVINDDFASESMAGNATYELLDFTMGDATGAAPATPKPLKVAVGLNNNSRLVDLRVQLNYLGVDGYNSANVLPDFPEFTTSYYGLGDNWDIGVLTYNKMQSGVTGVQVVGYWRMAGRAVISSNYGDGKSYSGAVFNDENVFFQGFNGLSIRGNDVHRVTALTSTTVQVPWNASHTVPVSGLCYLGGTAYAYTSTAKVGDKIVLSGFSINPSTKTTVGAECYFGTNPGFAGSGVSGGFITGLNHFSNYRAYDPVLETPFATPSKAHEISGNPLRDIDFYNIHFFDSDCIGFLHDTLHINYVGCYAEAQGYSGGIPGGAKGARYIASCRTELPDANGTYPAGNCRGLVWDKTSEMSDGSVDMYPVHRSATSRFIAGSRYMFMPDSFVIECEGFWSEQWDTKRRYDVGSRTFVNGLPGNEYFEIVDASLKRYMRLNAYNNRIGFGTDSPGTSIDLVGDEASCRMRVTSGLADPAFIWTNSVGSWTARPQNSSFNQWQLRYNNTIFLQLSSTDGTIFSGADNTSSLGTQTNRYKFGYFGTAIGDATHKVPVGYFNNLYTDSGTVAVSDETLKTDIAEIPDNVLDAWKEVEYLQYRLKDRVEVRGDDARTHVGFMAQRVEAAFIAAGIDPFKYGILCIDTWEASYESVTATHTVQEEVMGDDGSVTYRDVEEQYDTGEQRLISPAGSRYGVRYEQALVLEAALMRRTTKRLDERLAALEAK